MSRSNTVASQLRAMLEDRGGEVDVPLLKGGTFRARLVPGGIEVDNLGLQPTLSWDAFEAAVRCLEESGGRAARGDAMNARLGDAALPLDSVEGYVAHTVYGRQAGQTVFRRITPLACLLIWAGVCEAHPGELVLKRSLES